MSHHRFEHSAPSVQKNLSLFQLPTTDLGVERVQWVEYRPASQSDEVIEFAISGAGHQYIDLQNTKLFIKAKILKPDGSNLPSLLKDQDGDVTVQNMNPEGFVDPVNLWLHSLFSQVDLLMQQKVVDSCSLYPYKSYLETLIYPYEPWRGESEIIFKDSDNGMEVTKIMGDNMGLIRRGFRTTKVMR